MEKEYATSLISSITEEVFKKEAYPSDTFKAIQDEETLDLLDNLGYLEIDDENGQNLIPSETEIRLACRQFRLEFNESLVADLYDD